VIYEPAGKAATIKNRAPFARCAFELLYAGGGEEIFLLCSIRQFRIDREAARVRDRSGRRSCLVASKLPSTPRQTRGALNILRQVRRRHQRRRRRRERAKRGTRKTVGRKRHGGTMPAYDNYTSTTPPVYGRDSNHSRSRRSGLPRGAARLGSVRFGSAPP